MKNEPQNDKTLNDCFNALLVGLATELPYKQPETPTPRGADEVAEAATFEALPKAGEAGKIYVVLDTNKLYRWAGQYILLSGPELTANQIAALAAAPFLGSMNPVASIKDVAAPAELRRATGPILLFTTAAAAIAAADAGDTLVLRGIHPEIELRKNLHVVAYGATLAGVIISYLTYPDGLRSTWRGGFLTERLFIGCTNALDSQFKCQVYDLEFGETAYLHSHTNTLQNQGIADEFSFYNCRITHVQFNDPKDEAINHPQSIYFSGCSFVPATGGAVFRGIHPRCSLSTHNCRFQPRAGDGLFDSPLYKPVKISLHGFSTAALPEGLTNLLLNGLQVITNADPFAFPAAPETLSAQADNSVLEFVFESGFADHVVRTMGTRQAGKYTSQQLQNVSKVVYKVDGLEVAQLPLEIKSGTVLELIITRITGNHAAIISLLN